MSDRPRHDPRRRGWQFIDVAETGINTRRSYLAALLRIVLYPSAFAAFVALTIGSGPLRGVLLQYGPVVVAGAALVRTVAHGHRRPWRSLIAPDLCIDWRRLAIGLAVEFAILVGQLALVHALTGWPWSVSIPPALPLFALGVFLIPLQAASEEILFRGYLTQALGRVLRSRVLIAVIVALVFGLLHFNAYGPLTLPYFFVISLFFSLVSLRDERLELVVGGHSAMNLFAIAAANSGTLEPGVVGGAPAAVPFNWAAIAVQLVNGVLFYGMTRIFVRLLCERRSAP